MIRQAVRADLPQIDELIKRTVAAMNEAGNDQWNKEYPLRSHFEKDIEEKELYALTIEGNVAGIACFSETEHDEYPEINWSYPDKAITVKRMAVDPGHQGKGIAGRLYAYAEEVAKEKGLSYLKTDTFSKNLPAQRVFKRNGYRHISERTIPEKRETILYFEKKLP